MWNGTSTMKNSMEFPQKLKIQLPYDPAVALLGICPQKLKVEFGRYIYHSYSQQSYKSQEVEATQMCIYRWVDKKNVVYSYNEYLFFSRKKEGNPVICYSWMNLEATMLNEISQSQRDTLWLHLHEASKVVNFTEQSRRVEGLNGGRRGSCCSMGAGLLFFKMKKFWRSILQQCE